MTSVLSQGICQLIKEGADVMTGAEDVLEYFGKSLKEVRPLESFDDEVARGRTSTSLIEQRIIQKLQQEPMEIDVLSRLLKISSAEIGTVMSLMQLKGLIFIENGKYYVH